MTRLVPSGFRAKLLLIVGTAALAFAGLTLGGVLAARRVSEQLGLIQQRYLPKLQLGPMLENHFERIQRSLQDAVAAQDLDALETSRKLKAKFVEELQAAKPALDRASYALLLAAVDDYFDRAHELSRKLIVGETGEEMVDEMAAMQVRHARAAELVERAAAFDHAELAASFTEASRVQQGARQSQLLVAGACLLMVLLLSLWLAGGVLRSLRELGDGLERFGKGDFTQAIAVVGKDELAGLARQANQMAESLQHLLRERDQADWLKAGHAGLVHELRGELTPETVANRAAAFLARYLETPAAALYHTEEDQSLRLLGHYATSFTDMDRNSFQPGEGLVGQAATQTDLMIVTDPPSDYLRVRSGLGEGRPRALVLMPLIHFGKVTGVLELASFKPWWPMASELLSSVRETLSIAIEVARTHTAIRALLAETQRQTQRLAAQEDEMRATNEELSVQQEELRSANAELINQTRELQTHRHILEQKNAELDEARLGLERKADELSTVSAYKSQFLANMSHELRTPLNSMLLLSDLMAENQPGNLSEMQVEYCKTIHSAGKDLLALINQVLDLAKVESGRQDLTLEKVAPADFVDYAERMFGLLAHDKGLEFITELGPDLPSVISTDRQRVEQVLANLLGNAIKFTHRGHVALRLSARQGNLVLTVEDTGIGIASGDHERVFVPFEQVDAKADRRYGGTGLGLTIARELATRLGGELQLASEYGKGSRFVFQLPADGPAAMPEPRFERASAEIPAATSPTQSPPPEGYLLVIEDDAVFAEALRSIIVEQGLEHRIVGDGRAGLVLAKQHRPSGIVLDVRLADMDGWTVMEQLQRDPVTASIPVHFVSAQQGAERGLAMGAIGYLTKPATRRDLVRMLEALVPPSASRECRILIVEDDVDLSDSLVDRLQSESIVAQGARSAREALEALTKEHFSCMVLDLGLPDVDGLEFLESLQAQAGADTPPILVYTGRALSKAEAQRLETYTEAVVLKGAAGAERLVDEIRLFARRLKDGLPLKRRQPLPAQLSRVALEGRKILIADDDTRAVFALSALLRGRGIHVLIADTGKAALTVLDENPDVELVLMDIMMPEMDGYEAMRRIRQDARFANLPMIAVTAKAMIGDRDKSLQAGANDHLSKPIDSERLFATLQAHLGERVRHAV